MNTEEDLFAVMDDLSHQQGYPTSKEPPTKQRTATKASNTNKEKAKHTQHKTVPIGPDTGWEGAIWNPLISHSIHPTNHHEINHHPPSSVVVPPEMEVQRRRSYEKYKKKCLALFVETRPSTSTSHELQLWKKLPSSNIMEHWHFCIKLEEATQKLQLDPILISPSMADSDTACALLIEEMAFQWGRICRKDSSSYSKPPMELGGLPEFLHRYIQKLLMKGIRRIVRDVYQEFHSKLQRLRIQPNSSSKLPKLNLYAFRGKNKSNGNYHDTKEEEDDDDDEIPQVSLTYSGLTLYINNAHYQKLKTIHEHLFFTHHPSMSSQEHPHNQTALFREALFSLLCRYDTLAGAGLQSALTGNVFDVLLEEFSCTMECFASPLNSRYSHYCSAFPDVDKPFGSQGSFFEFPFPELSKGGCFQANPPFVAHLIQEMKCTIEKHLQSTTAKPLMFIIFIPKWDTTKGHDQLQTSIYCAKHILLSQKEDTHYYCEGTQHRRQKRYRMASFDTSIFFLMNDKAKEKWILSDEIVEKIKHAFQQLPPEHGWKAPILHPDASSTPQKIHKRNIQNDPRERQMDKKRNATNYKHEHKDSKGRKRKETQKKQKKQKKKKNILSNKTETDNQIDILSSLGIIKGP